MAQKRKTSGGGAAATRQTVVVNKKARHSFEILDTVECGISLRGTEVKSLRDKKVSLDEAYGRIYDGEVFLVGARIEPYSHASVGNHEPTRKRKLLLRRMEIRKLEAKVTQKGLTLVPLEIYFGDRGKAKLSLGLARGKKQHDKREDVKKREAAREMRRIQ